MQWTALPTVDAAHNEPDPLPNPSLLDPVDDEQDEDIKFVIDNMLRKAHTTSLPEKYWQHLHSLVFDYIGPSPISIFSIPLPNLYPSRLT